ESPAIEQRRQAFGHVEGRRAPGPGLALPHSRPVRNDHGEAIGQPRSQLAPDLEIIRVAVQQDQGWTAAQPGHAEASPPRHGHGLDRGGQQHQERSSRTRSAARMPEMAQKLTHWPGWGELPARKSRRTYGLRWASRPAPT